MDKILSALGNLPFVLERFAPGQAGAIFIGFVLTFLVLGDRKKLLGGRNLLVLLLFLPTIPLIDIHQWPWHYEEGRKTLLIAAFTGLYAITAIMTVFALWNAMTRRRRIDLGAGAGSMALIALVMVFLNVAVLFSVTPSDAGIYTNLGAQRWMETGRMPYGDEFLRADRPDGQRSPGHGAASTYGPLLYVAHMPFQMLVGERNNPADLDPMDLENYRRPKHPASQFACALFHLIGLVSLFTIGKRLADATTGWTLVALYAGSSYVIGIGGSDIEAIGGLIYISHIAPVAMVLCALAFIRRPVFAGISLAIGAGALFWPAFLFPTFAGFYFWRKKGLLCFMIGFVVVGAAIGGLTYQATGTLGDRGPIELFMSSTLEHQEGFQKLDNQTGALTSEEYGNSLFSFWGVWRREGKSFVDLLQKPISGTSSTLKPMFLFFIFLCLLGFFLARRRKEAQLAFLLAMLGAGIQLWKTHAGGTYVEWYYPLILVGLLCRGREDDEVDWSEAPVEEAVPQTTMMEVEDAGEEA